MQSIIKPSKPKAFIEPARYQINLEHSVGLNDLLPIVSNSPFVPPDREYLFAKGLYTRTNRNFFTSTRILIPQIENSVRYLCEMYYPLDSTIGAFRMNTI